MNKKIAIIGAGYTGLTAAYDLSKKGHAVTIFERSEDIGGLASGFKIEGENIEKTYHHLFRTDTDIINFAKEIGIQNKLVWKQSSVGIYYDGKTYPFISPLDLIKFSPVSFVDRLRTGLTILYLQKSKNWRKLIHESAYDWIGRNSGKTALKVIWEPLLKGKFDKYYKDISMAWLWARLHIRANSRKPLEPGEKLGYFEGGFQTFTDCLTEKLKDNKVKIITNAQVTSIKSQDKVEIEVNNEKLEFDKVISTIPSYIFGELVKENKTVTDKYLEKLRSINYLGAIVMVFSSTQDIGKYYWNNINDISKPFLVFLNHTKFIEKENYNGKYIYYIGAYLPHEHKYFKSEQKDIEKDWFGALKEIFSEFDESKVREKHLFKLKNAQHIVEKDYESKIPKYKTPIPNVYLSNFSQIYPEDRGTNFAVREGKKIVKLILEED